MGIQQSLQPAKLVYKWRASPMATSASWGTLCINGAQSQRGGWAVPWKACPMCLETSECMGSSPMPCSMENVLLMPMRMFQAAEHQGKFCLISDVCCPERCGCFHSKSCAPWAYEVVERGTLHCDATPFFSLGNTQNAPQWAQQLPPAAASGSGDSHGVKGERTEPRETGPSQEAGPWRLALPPFAVRFEGRFCLDWLSVPDGKQRAKQPPARRCLLAASPIQGQPCARESPPQRCGAWKMSYSETDIAACSHTQLQSELFNCRDIIEVQTVMPVFFPKWKKGALHHAYTEKYSFLKDNSRKLISKSVIKNAMVLAGRDGRGWLLPPRCLWPCPCCSSASHRGT